MKLWNKFIEAVETHFRFLETEMGFVRIPAKSPNVIYVSDKIQVQIYYDADGRNELDLGLRRVVDDPRKSLSLGIGMLMKLHGDTEGYLSPFPSTPESLDVEVKRLVDLLRKHGLAILHGDMRDFDRMEQVDRELAAKVGTTRQ